MEVINTEKLVNSLFVMGFNQVDSTLFTLVLDKLINNRNGIFKFDDTNTKVNEYVDCKDSIYKLKDNCELSLKVNKYNTLEDILRKGNERIIIYLTTLDFNEIITKKVALLSLYHNDNKDLYSDKEKKIIDDIQYEYEKKTYELTKTKRIK